MKGVLDILRKAHDWESGASAYLGFYCICKNCGQQYRGSLRQWFAECPGKNSFQRMLAKDAHIQRLLAEDSEAGQP